MAIKSYIILLSLLVLLDSCLSDQTLIDQTCKKTPYPSLCAASLRSDSRSASADLRGLARVMVDVIDAKARTTQNKIKALLAGNPIPQLKAALTSCVGEYNAIIVGDVAQAREAVYTGDYKFAVDAANDAAAEAMNCESGFGGKSPISGLNSDTHGVSVVASVIVTMLM